MIEVIYRFVSGFESAVWTEDDVQSETATDVLLPQIFS
jgi:hypothetical protein